MYFNISMMDAYFISVVHQCSKFIFNVLESHEIGQILAIFLQPLYLHHVTF